jgi:GNAT superfamily N-acetyltransferase
VPHLHQPPPRAPALPGAAWLRALWALPDRDRVLAAVLQRRLLGRPRLAMRSRLADPREGPGWSGLELTGFRPSLEGGCCDLLNAVATLGPWSQRRFRRQVLAGCGDPERFVWVALEDGRPVAFATLLSPASTGWLPLLDKLAVHPDLRGRGLGEGLIRQVRWAALEAGHERLGLETACFRLPAIRLYLRNGFEPWPRSVDELRRWRAVLADPALLP